MPAGLVPLRVPLTRVPPPPQGPWDTFFPPPQQLQGWEGRSQGWGGWSSDLLFVCFRSGLFANYQMGLYLNKNQFSAAPPLLLVFAEQFAACRVMGGGRC